MAILSKGITFNNGEQVTAAKLNALVDSASFVSGSGGTTDNSTLEVSGGVLAVKDSGITASKIATNAVTTVKIADANVTTAKIADANITTAKILDANVTTAKIADLNVTTGKIAELGVTTAKIANAAITTAKLAQPLTLGTAQNSTSGTSIDFTSIPSWVNRVTVLFSGVSTSGTSTILIRIGSGGAPLTSGYTASAGAIGTSSNSSSDTTSSTGFPISGYGIAIGNLFSGSVIFSKISGNTWVAQGIVYRGTVGEISMISGLASTASTLDFVRITTSGGTDTFDAGQINIMYE